MNRLATGDWLERPLVTFVAGLMLAGTAIALGVLFGTAHGTVDALSRPLGTDFSSFWTAGRMALEGQPAAAYDWQAHHAMQRQTHGIDDYFPWSYPPSFLLLASAIAVLPYVPALVFWQATSALAALFVFRQILPAPRAMLIAAAFPAVLICLGHGQTGFLTAALMAGGALLLPRRPLAAGILFGMLAYKPQFGLLIPAVLLAGGYWRAIASASITVIVTIALTAALWGWPVWQAFFDSIPLTREIVFEAGDTGFEKFQSVFAWVRLWGGSVGWAYAAQAVVTAIVIALGVWIWRSEVDQRLKGAALLTGAMLSSPYVLDYDFILLGFAMAMLVAHALERGFRPWEKTLIAAAWITPLVARTAAQVLLLPVGFLILATLFAMIALRAGDEMDERAESPSVCAETRSA